MDINLPFGLRWGATCCQDVTNMIVSNLVSKGLQVLSYMDDFYMRAS